MMDEGTKLQAFGSQASLLPLSYTPPRSFSNKHTRRIGKATLISFTFLVLLGYTQLDCVAQNLPSTKIRNPAYLITARHGAVASENERCSIIGVDILKEGGNAVDAAIAATFCTGVVNMFSSGIGGGGFMTVRIPPTNASATSEVYTIDFRETAPARATTTMYDANPRFAAYGGLAAGVPGEVKGLHEAYKRWGSTTLPWKRLVEPSVTLAAGWEVDKELGKRIPWYGELMLKDPDWSPIFAPNGRLLKEGEKISRTNLSHTLSSISKDGADAFYNPEGAIAKSIVRKVQAKGGILTLEDIKNYSVKVERALEGSYRGRKVYTTHAPTSGPVLIHMLNLIGKYNMTNFDGLNVHRFVEVMKFGFAARTKICDPQFADNITRITEIPTEEFAQKIFKNITDDRTHTPEYYNPIFDVKIDHGTSHISVVDENGMAVSLTSTVNLIFGSQVLDPETGIILNDEMDDFSIPGVPNEFGLYPSPYNFPEPRKRPLSSIAPAILEHPDGSFYIAIGGSGGSRIFPSVVQVLLNLDWGLGSNLSGAIEYGRLHDQLYPLYLDADDVYPKPILHDLLDRGHNISIVDVNRVAAVVQAVMKNGSTIFAASDSRKNGIAAGY